LNPPALDVILLESGGVIRNGTPPRIPGSGVPARRPPEGLRGRPLRRGKGRGLRGRRDSKSRAGTTKSSCEDLDPCPT